MKNCIVITNVDSFAGYAIAFEFLSKWNHSSSSKPVTEFRLLCHERQGLHELEKLGGKIFEVENFDDKKEIRAIMRGVFYVVLIPEYSTERVQEGEAIIDAAEKEGVDYMTMLSYLGIDKLEEKVTSTNKFENLNQYLELERKVADNFNCASYCIMQVPIFHQLFYYFGPMIDDKQQIALPTKEHKEWHSIDLGDLVSAVFNLSSSDSSEKNQTLFRFTGRHTITAEQMVKYASKGLEREDMTYNKIDPEEMYNYLSRIHGDNRFRERPNHSLFEGEDRSYLFPLGEYLNETCIHTLIEYWQLINTTEDTGRTSEDLDNALDGRESISLKQFFKDNKGQFQRLR